MISDRLKITKDDKTVNFFVKEFFQKPSLLYFIFKCPIKFSFTQSEENSQKSKEPITPERPSRMLLSGDMRMKGNWAKNGLHYSKCE